MHHDRDPHSAAFCVTDHAATRPDGIDPSAPSDRLGLLGIDHVGLAVADLPAAIEFQRRVFGLRCVHQETNEDQGVREAMLAVGPGGGTVIQLVAPTRPDSAIARFLDRSGPGMQHVAYAVADIEAASAALRAGGVRLLYETPRNGTHGSKINFAHPKDTGGVLVELVQRAAEPEASAGPPVG